MQDTIYYHLKDTVTVYSNSIIGAVNGIDKQTIAMLISLVAVIISPIVSLIIARRQIRANTISTNRQNWINPLRELVSNLISEIQIIPVAISERISTQQVILEQFKKITQIEREIVLMLNPDEPAHMQLEDHIRNIVKNMECLRNSEEFYNPNLADDILNATRPLLKKEWERVKKGN